MKAKLYVSFLSLCFVFAVLITALFSLLTLEKSRAWFSENLNVTANGLSVSVKSPGDFEEIRYFRVTDMTIETDGEDKHNVYSFSYDESALLYKLPAIDENGNITETVERTSFLTPVKMRPYSDLGGDCQVLIEVTAKNNDQVTLGIDTQTENYLGQTIENAITNAVYNISPSNLPLTSVVRFAILESIDDNTAASTYEISELDMEDSMLAFVTETDGVYAFANPLAGGLSVTPNAENKFYVFVDYNPLAVEDVTAKIQTYVDAATLDATSRGESYTDIIVGETNLDFKADFNFYVVKH